MNTLDNFVGRVSRDEMHSLRQSIRDRVKPITDAIPSVSEDRHIGINGDFLLRMILPKTRSRYPNIVAEAGDHFYYLVKQTLDEVMGGFGYEGRVPEKYWKVNPQS